MSLKQKLKTMGTIALGLTLGSALTLSSFSALRHMNNSNPRTSTPTPCTLETKVIASEEVSPISSSITYVSNPKAYKIKGHFEAYGLRICQESEENETYVFSDGFEHPESELPYLSPNNQKITIGVPANIIGPKIEFLPGNQYIDINEENFLILQPISEKTPGVIRTEKRAWNKQIPRISSSTGFRVYNGEKAIIFNEQTNREVKGPKQINENPFYCPGKKPIPLQVSVVDKIGQRLHGRENTWDAVFDRHGRIIAGISSELESYPGSLRLGEYTSSRLAYHDLTQEEQDAIKSKALGKLNFKPIKSTPNYEILPTPQPIPLASELEQIPSPPERSVLRTRNYEPIPAPPASESRLFESDPEPETPLMRDIPSNITAIYQDGEEYKRIPKTNQFRSKSGKIIIAN